jgi:hypothetical protein
MTTTSFDAKISHNILFSTQIYCSVPNSRFRPRLAKPEPYSHAYPKKHQNKIKKCGIRPLKQPKRTLDENNRSPASSPQPQPRPHPRRRQWHSLQSPEEKVTKAPQASSQDTINGTATASQK